MDYKIGHTYRLSKNGEFVTFATWVDDPNHGLCFIDFSKGVMEVCFTDTFDEAVECE